MTKKKNKPIQFKRRPQPGPAPLLPGFVKPDLSHVRLVDMPEPEGPEEAEDRTDPYASECEGADTVAGGEQHTGYVYPVAAPDKQFPFTVKITPERAGSDSEIFELSVSDPEGRTILEYDGRWIMEPGSQEEIDILHHIVRRFGTVQ